MSASHHNGNGGDELAQLKAAADILERAAANRALLGQLSVEDRTRLLKVAGEIYAPDVNQRRRLVKATIKQRKAEKKQRDDTKLNQTGIRKLRAQKVFTTPNVFPPLDFKQEEVRENPDFREVVEPQNCYICKQDYSTIHHFYDQLCPACAELNWRKRAEQADLRGRVALLTGGRVKIGYQAGIKLLRCGAHLIVTTRFPRDSAVRYAAEPDFQEWGHRLEIFGLDLRHTPSVEAFCRAPAGDPLAAGFHHQQRLSDGAASAGFLHAHDGAGERPAAPSAGGSAQAARGLRRIARLSYSAGGRRPERRTPVRRVGQ